MSEVREEQTNERGDVYFWWRGDNQYWFLQYEIGTGTGFTRELKDGESVLITRCGDYMVLTRNEDVG